jgi:hypothetical protein
MAAYLPVELSSRAQASLPLAEVIVTMPCFVCTDRKPALDLRIVRVCDECLRLVHASAQAMMVGEGVVGGGAEAAPSGGPASPPHG